MGVAHPRAEAGGVADAPDIRSDKTGDAATAFLREYYLEALQITRPRELPVFFDPMVLAKG